ncbi:hypothetical protein [Kaarinaea lacus]
MSKKIAVVVRDRQDEAIRMSIGLTLMDDSVDLYLLNRKLEKTDENELNIETLGEMDINIYSNLEDSPDSSYISTESMAKNLLTYDHILPY